MITQSRIKELFDYREGKLYWKIQKGPRAKIGVEAGRVRTDGYRQVNIDNKRYSIHRLVFLLHHGYLPAYIDHIDTDKLNNHIENLRAATSSQNNLNCARRKDNASGVKNVSWHKSTGKWQAQVAVNGMRKYLGLYDDLASAERVVVEARNKYHKEFANHG